MGLVGDAYDNALCESLFATLECELLDRQRFATPAEARLAVFDFIDGWYNPRRRHSALDYLAAMMFERSHGTRIAPCPQDRRSSQGALSWYPLGGGAVRSFESSSLSTKPGQLHPATGHLAGKGDFQRRDTRGSSRS